MARNVVKADFSSAGDNRYISTKRRDQYNYGQKLEIIGLNLPDTFEVDFCNEEDPDTITVIGQNNVVDIPDQFFETGRGILAYIYLHEGTDDGETEYRIFIPVGARAERTDAEPTPVQQDVITQAIAALNEGVERAEAAAEEIESMHVEAETLEPGSEATASWEDGTLTLGIPEGIQGEAGIPGERGADGIGIEDIIINDDHTLTVKLSDGNTYTTEPVMGEKGDKGDQGEKGDRGERGLRGVGILQTFMNANYTLTLVYDDGSTYTTYPLRGERGEKGEKGDPGESAALRNLVDGNADGSARGVNTASEGYNPYYFMGENAVALGDGTKAVGDNAVAIGEDTYAQGNNAFASGKDTIASAPGSHAEGLGGMLLYPQSYNSTNPEGKSTSGAHSSYAHTEGIQTLSGSQGGHAEGDRTIAASGKAAHSEGSVTLAVGEASHAEGIGGTYEKNGNTVISGAYAPAAHTEGYQTRVASSYGHAEGMRTEASYVAHAEGIETEAQSMASHTEGRGTIANHIMQHVFGEYNEADDSAEAINDRGNYVEIVGNGTADNARSNARTLDWDGNEVLAGKLTVGADPTDDMDVATKKYVDDHGGSGGQGRDGITPTVTITPITGGNNIAFSYGSGDSRNTDVDVMDGVDGTDGQDGQDGADGVSPTVSVTDITGGHAVAITDASGTESFNVMDGTDGQDGTDGTTFTPSVSSAGVISWTNDGGKTNPQSVDLVAAVENAIIDDTLTQQGQAADAKAVGDKMAQISEVIGSETVYEYESTPIQFNLDSRSSVSRGVTFDQNTDGTIHVYGTNDSSTSRAVYKLDNLPFSLIANKTYRLSGRPVTDADCTIDLRLATGGGIYIDRGDGVIFTPSENNTYYMAIGVGVSATIDVVFTPKLEELQIIGQETVDVLSAKDTVARDLAEGIDTLSDYCNNTFLTKAFSDISDWNTSYDESMPVRFLKSYNASNSPESGAAHFIGLELSFSSNHRIQLAMRTNTTTVAAPLYIRHNNGSWLGWAKITPTAV